MIPMAPKEPPEFHQFSEAFQRWQYLLPPIGDLHDYSKPTYPIDLNLDHEVSSLATVGGRALKGDTAPDWAKIVPEYLADLSAIERTVDLAPIPVDIKKKYKDYISECRLVWEKIALLPVPADGRLGFRKYVLSKFRFLETVFGFHVLETTPIKVRYESSELFVELKHFPSSPDLSFEIGRLNETDDHHWFSLNDLWYWAGLGPEFEYTRFDLESRDGVAGFIAVIARFIEKYADPLLRSDRCSFDALLAKQSERERLITDKNES